MKHIESFELFELNKVGKYYQANPDKIYTDIESSKTYRGKKKEYLPHRQWMDRKEEKINKISLQSGIAVSSLVPALNSVFDYKEANIKHIPEKYWSVLNKLTVKPNNIPTLWRGILIPLGFDVDLEEYVKNLTNEIIMDVKSKCISWSKSKDIAIEFMGRSASVNYKLSPCAPKVKVLLKYENVPLDKVIVDTRDLKHMSLMREEEVILQPSALGFTIGKVFIVEKGYETEDSPSYIWQKKHSRWKDKFKNDIK